MSLEYTDSFMSLPLPLFVRKTAVSFCWILLLALPATGFSQTNFYGANGTEYSIAGSLPGDQIWPDMAAGPSGGFLVWQDNATDGSGWGISARRMDNTLSGTLSAFRVNVTGTNDQENARVAMLKDGGAAFVWQGGVEGLNQHIYARFLSTSNTWLTTNDVLVSSVATNIFILHTTNTTTTITTNVNRNGTTFTTNITTTVTTTTNINTQNLSINPALAVLDNSNIVVVWSSFNLVASGSMQDVYGQIVSPGGQKIGTNFLVNQYVSYNQRTPSVAALKNGGFVVGWVSEQQRVVASSIDNSFYAAGGANYVSTNETAIAAGQNTNYSSSASAIQVPSVDIEARLYNSNGVPVGGEFLVNSNLFPCANPAIAGGSDGGFMIAWTARNITNYTYSLDVYARSYSAAGIGGQIVTVNSTLYGDEYAPRISSIGTDYFITWTSLGQDGSREGVYGRFIRANGSFANAEFRVNTTTAGAQIYPVVTSDGVSQFAVAWSSYAGGLAGMDLFAQRYLNVGALLAPMNAPFVAAPFTLSNNVYQPQLVVSWPPLELQGISVAHYEVYVDGNTSPTGVTSSNSWTMAAADGLTTSSIHSFAVDYVTTDGRQSPVSPSTSGTTWSGLNWGGIPYEWMQMYFGNDVSKWPSPTADSDGDGANNLDEFLAGTIPNDASSVLRQQLIQTPQGMFLTWNTQPGLTYQVQVTTNLTTWNNFGAPRYAAGTSDSIPVGSDPAGYYRIQLQR